MLKINILVPEYPSYSIYKNIKNEKKEQVPIKPTESQIIEDSECVYEFVLQNFRDIKEQDIIVMGRSLGCAPAIHLAGSRRPCCLYLISPFKSVKELIREQLNFLTMFIDDKFNNLEKIQLVSDKTSVLIIHGKQDTIVPCSHSVELAKHLQKNVYFQLFLQEEMTHNNLDFYSHLIKPIFNFLKKLHISTRPNDIIQRMEFNQMFYKEHSYNDMIFLLKLLNCKRLTKNFPKIIKDRSMSIIQRSEKFEMINQEEDQIYLKMKNLDKLNLKRKSLIELDQQDFKKIERSKKQTTFRNLSSKVKPKKVENDMDVISDFSEKQNYTNIN